MAKYECWRKENLGARNKLPDSEHFTPDVAMDEAKRMSRGFTEETMRDWITNTSHKIQVPNSVAVIVRDTDVRTWGWGIGGKWYPVKDHCQRCNDTGMDVTRWREFCAACKGASFKPKV